MDVTFDLKRLMLRTKLGGAAAEKQYGEVYKRAGVKLRRKYTIGGTAKDNSKGRK